ncbi:hypothetical protein [Flagellimonas sp. W118]|uniref:Dph6-related ATP pyrophosphatase n=1 Tax=Flagellimonas sp. W118 TaxID=3410791 RepID=UPI003BF5CD81
MTNKPKTYFNWSSGKDSALALYHIQQQNQYQIDCLLTAVNSHYDRVSMHGLRKTVLEAQAEAVGIPLVILEVPVRCFLSGKRTFPRTYCQTPKGC